MNKITVFTVLTAGVTTAVLAAGSAWAHDIEAAHVHESHIVQGLGLALLAAAGCLGVVLLARRRPRR